MKKGSFESDLRKQLDDYEVAAPEGLWQAIEDALPVAEVKGMNVGPSSSASPRRSALFSRWAAVALILLLGGGYMAWRSFDDSPSAEMAKNESEQIRDGGAKAEHEVLETVSEEVGLHRSPSSVYHSKSKGQGSALRLTAMNVAGSTDRTTGVENPDDIPTEMIASSEDEKETSVEERNEYREADQAEELMMENKYNGERRYAKTKGPLLQVARGRGTKRDEPRLTASLYAGNLVGGQRVDMDNRPVMMSYDLAGMGDGHHMLAPVPVYDLEERTKYHQPLRFGLSLSYALSPRWRVQTGVVWQRVQTDLIRSVNGERLVTENVYHYVGVPLRMSYDVWRRGSFKVYGVAGAEADFNVKAQKRIYTKEQSAEKDRVQWSVDAGAGLQYNVVPRVGLYAETGVVYFLDNRSNVDNVFKDKPLNWNMQLGLRFDLR